MQRTTKYKSIYRLGPNRFQVRVPDGKHPVTGKPKEIVRNFTGTLAEALDLQGELRRAAKTSIRAVGNPTLNELCLRYLEHAEETLSPSTVKKYRSEFHDKVEKGIGRRPAKSITTEELDRMFQTLRKERGIKGKTVNRFRSFLSSVYEQGMAWKWASFNPVVATTSFYNEEHDGKAVELETIRAVLKAYETVDPDMGEFLELAMLNQLRRSEGCGLRVENLHPATAVLTVDRVILEPKGGGYVVKPYLKNKARQREIDLDPRSLEIINRFAAGKDRSAYLFSDNGGKDPWLPGRVTQSQARERSRICPNCLSYAKKPKRCEACGVDRGVYFTVHDLRGHTTTALIEEGMSKAAQQRGGWKDEATMLKHYNKYTKKARSEAVATITELFKKTGA